MSGSIQDILQSRMVEERERESAFLCGMNMQQHLSACNCRYFSPSILIDMAVMSD